MQAYIESENRRLERDPVRSFDSREINIRMEYRFCPNMILIDTPGLIHAPSGGNLNPEQRAVAAVSVPFPLPRPFFWGGRGGVFSSRGAVWRSSCYRARPVGGRFGAVLGVVVAVAVVGVLYFGEVNIICFLLPIETGIFAPTPTQSLNTART